MKKKLAFTLAEVLITLAIIGVVAAMTIPSVIVRTNQQEFKTGAKKALSVLTNAVQLVNTQDGLTFADGERFAEALIQRMNVIKVEDNRNSRYLPNAAYAMNTGGDKIEYPSISGASIMTFYTADGFRYSIMELDGAGENEYAVFLVDVNGDKGPNTIDTPVSEMVLASCSGSCDYENPEWPDYRLTDTFVIVYENGKSAMFPYEGAGQ